MFQSPFDSTRSAFRAGICSLFIVMTSTACDPYGESIVIVEVPVALQTALSMDYPVQVVALDGERPCVEVVRIACEPSNEPVKYQWQNGSVCPGPSTVRFWMVPLLPEQVGKFQCGQQSESRRNCIETSTLPPALTEETTVSIFTKDDCNEGTEHHQVVLELK